MAIETTVERGAATGRPSAAAAASHRAGPDWPFWLAAGVVAAGYGALIVGMIVADTRFAPGLSLLRVLGDPEIRAATWLTLASCTISALLSLAVAIPLGYLLSRGRFPGRRLFDAVLDIPIVLPPLVVGLSLLILFMTPLGRALEDWCRFTGTIAGVVLAQFVVGCAFAVRIMRSTFDHLPERPEEVALTLGCTRGQAVLLVTLPAARRGAVTALSIAWARCLGEFGPIMVFAGATPFRTEVLPSTVFIQASVGELESAVAVSLLMIAMALVVLVVMRTWGDAGVGHDRR
jgi:molybdate transport system permease protein